MVKLIYVLYRIRLLSPAGLFRLTYVIFKYGINVMALLSFAEKSYAEKTALADDRETLSYKQLLSKAERISAFMNGKFKLKSGRKVGFLCKNHASLVKSVFAVSMTGADIYLLNAEMSINQFNILLEHYDFDLLIHDSELSALVEQSNYSKETILSYHDALPAINNIPDLKEIGGIKLKRASTGKIVILTGGTTGIFKAAPHKPSVFNYLNPFITVILRLKLLDYDTAYIATPVYHGYGLSQLFLFIALGKKIVITKGFNAARACSLIKSHNVEVVTVVPSMLYKMLKCNSEELKTLSCIVSGGAELNPRLAEETLGKLGNVLYNLYGASEAGLNMIATPEDLRYSSKTIGKKIDGVRLKILDECRNEVKTGKIGQFCVRNRWSMRNNKVSWIETGDLGYKDENGYYFLCGRADDMIVSGGENVYPFELEEILKRHPDIEEAAVIGVSDEVFGQRLKAFVLPVRNACITKEELFDWLRKEAARFQMPKEIVFVESMPYTPLGKLDKKQFKPC